MVRIRARTAISLFFLPYATCALAQNAPVLPSHPWHSAEEQRIEADASNFHDSRFNIDPTRTYSLAELVDLAEAQNPKTRVAWERARAQAAALGVARRELYPTVAAAALSETDRSNVLFGNEFSPQTIQDFQVGLDLNYTLFDFGARSGRISAAKAKLLAANFAFNDTHRNVIYQVDQGVAGKFSAAWLC